MKTLPVSLFSFLLLVACVLPQTNNCPATEDAVLIEKFNIASTQLEVSGCEDDICHVQELYGSDSVQDKDINCTSCESIYKICRSIILNVTAEVCLQANNHNTTSRPLQTTAAEAYGYGFLMILFVSLCSLLGIFLVPLINSNSRLGRQTYEYMYAFMIAIGISALISDAVLHLIPHAFGLHGHEDDHSSTSTEGESQNFIWKGCLVLLGVYSFYLLEVTLHGLGDCTKKKSGSNGDHHHHNYACSSGDVHYSSDIPEMKEIGPEAKKLAELSTENGKDDSELPDVVTKQPFCRRIKPVAWLIIVGDALHNFADGLALGAAIVQSVTLGVSTMFALLFHEIPHELGDYVILVKSGMHWVTALLFNFLSSLTAIIGFFIGVAISSNSTEANGWILSLTAGLFIYIAMTDLLPELIHGGDYVKVTKTGWRWSLRFVLANLGFYISFAFLLVLAVYEENLNRLIE